MDDPRTHREPFGVAPDGREVDCHTLSNRNGLRIRLLTWGGVIQSILAPDRAGGFDEITLGYDTLDGYIRPNPYFGALIGRYANRITGARFRLDDREVRVTANEGANHLHGGERGFHARVWTAEPFTEPAAAGVALTRASPDGEEGYEGELRVRVVITLDDLDRLAFDYEATTDRPTPVNLTQHSYFNLAGRHAADILGHRLTIHASSFTPVDASLLPTGEIRRVAGTPFDFTRQALIGDRVAADHEQLGLAGGFDHNFVLDRDGPALIEAARLVEPVSGRVLEIHTTEPGLQFFSGNFGSPIRGHGGRMYGRHAGVTLETQHFPDSPNRPAFPSTLLLPGRTFRSRTVYRFGVEA